MWTFNSLIATLHAQAKFLYSFVLPIVVFTFYPLIFLCLNSVNEVHPLARAAQHPSHWNTSSSCSDFVLDELSLSSGLQGSVPWDLTNSTLNKPKSGLIKARVVQYFASCFPHFPQDLCLHYFISMKLYTIMEMRFEARYRAGHMTLSRGRKFWKLNSLVTLVKTTKHLLTEFNEYYFPQPKSP